MKRKLDTTKSCEYNCKTVTTIPPHNFIKFNIIGDRTGDEMYKDAIVLDACLEKEIQYLWSQGVYTTGCCCGHGTNVGCIQVRDESDILKMKELGYQQYIYETVCGGIDRSDAFIPKSTYHIAEEENQYRTLKKKSYVVIDVGRIKLKYVLRNIFRYVRIHISKYIKISCKNS